MSPTPTTSELDFALQIRRALDEHAANLPPATADRLAAARRIALARKKPAPDFVFVPALAGAAGMFGSGLLPSQQAGRPAAQRTGWLRRVARAWPLTLIVAGVIGVTYWENMQRAAELADIDAAMLSDNLPLNAYLDHGFNAYLSHAR